MIRVSSNRLRSLRLAAGALAIVVLQSSTPMVEAQDLDSLLESEPRSESETTDRDSPAQPHPSPVERSTTNEQESAPDIPVPSETAAPSADAPEAPPSKARVIEEIVVTAQKREQSLQDVPISVSVVSGDFMKEQGITDLSKLSAYVPNVSVSHGSGPYNDVRIRGFGSAQSNTKAFEQSVGLVIDGIPYTRLPYWQSGLFDLERVEVMRGPQGTLFGKNNTGGIFNLITAKPTDEYTGYIGVALGELDARRFDAAVGGAVVDGFLNVRVSGLSDERSGYMKNTTARTVPDIPAAFNSHDRKAVRVQVDFPDLLGADLVVGYERAKSDTNGRGWELKRIEPNHIPFLEYWDPNVDLKPDNFVGSTDLQDFTRADMEILTANAGYQIGDWALDLVTGYSNLKWNAFLDFDLIPAPLVWESGDRDDNPQTVVELRATSPSLPGLLGLGGLTSLPLGRSDFVAGFFFDDRRIRNSVSGIGLNSGVLAQLLAADATGVVPPCPNCRSLDEEAPTYFDQNSNSFAGFGHFNWYIIDRLTLEFGMRFTNESKSAKWRGECIPGRCVALAAVVNAENFTQRLSLSESGLTPKATVRYDLTDEVNVYAAWAKGFKSGGFNAKVFNNNALSGMQFGPEKATSWELGAKMNVLHRTVLLNLALYRQTVSDLQVYIIEPDLSLVVRNAGKSRSQGVEADMSWLPTNWLALRGAVGLNDTKYLDFQNGTCPYDRTSPGGPPCDLTGRPFEFAPRWTATATAGVRVPLSSGLELGAFAPFSLPGIDMIGALTVEYQDNYYADWTLDPRSRQPSFIRLAANLGFGNAAQGWSVRVIGDNLTDEVVSRNIREVPIVGKSWAQAPDPPRLVRGEFRWEF